MLSMLSKLSMFALYMSNDSCLTCCSSTVCNVVNAVCSGRSWDFSVIVPVARLRDGFVLLDIEVTSTSCRRNSVRQ